MGTHTCTHSVYQISQVQSMTSQPSNAYISSQIITAPNISTLCESAKHLCTQDAVQDIEKMSLS